jgi:hypothetical protein
MDFRLRETESRVPVVVGGNEFKIVRSATVFGSFSDDVDRVELDFYRKADKHLNVRVVVCAVDGGRKEHHWEIRSILIMEENKPRRVAEVEHLRRIKEFLPFAKHLGIAATCLGNMINGLAPH